MANKKCSAAINIKSARKAPAGCRRTALLKAAKKYCEAGYSIVPLEPADKDRPGSGKRPIAPNGVRDATSNWAKFRKLVGALQDFNIGIATGEANGIIVVDIDRRNDGFKTGRELTKKRGAFPACPTTYTGGDGLHLFYKVPADLVFTRTKLGPGIDLLSNNSYVVAPPSRHASGKLYKWRDKYSLLEFAPRKLAPQWAAAIERAVKKKQSVSKKPVPTKVSSRSAELLSPIAEGERNNRLTQLAGHLRGLGHSVEEVEAELKRINDALCEPPLEAIEVEKIAESSARWSVEPSIASQSAGEVVARLVLNGHFAGGRHLRAERDGQFYQYNGKHWQTISTAVLSRLCLNVIREKVSQGRTRLTSTVNEAVQLLGMLQAVQDDELHFSTPPPPVINVLNGEIWLMPDGKTELRPHAPETGLRHVLNVNYEPKAKCPEYDTALEQIFEKCSDPTSMINVWHEVCGYVIQSSRPRPTIVMMCGAGANGKTKLLDTLKRLLGPDAVCSSSINALESSRFATGGLVGKLLFVDDDVAVGAKLPDGTLKKLSEEKELTGERKFRDQFNFVNRAMPLLLCNNIPALSDLSHGMRRRLMVFEFKRIFADHEQDRGLFNRIWASELSGVLNRALQGWRRFVQNKHEFSASRDLVSGQKSVLNQANPLLTFIDEWCVKKPKASTPLKTLYEGFVRWADESGYRHKITRNTLKRNLEHLGYTFKRVNGIRLVSGIALKSIEVHSV